MQALSVLGIWQYPRNTAEILGAGRWIQIVIAYGLGPATRCQKQHGGDQQDAGPDDERGYARMKRTARLTVHGNLHDFPPN